MLVRHPTPTEEINHVDVVPDESDGTVSRSRLVDDLAFLVVRQHRRGDRDSPTESEDDI